MYLENQAFNLNLVNQSFVTGWVHRLSLVGFSTAWLQDTSTQLLLNLTGIYL